MNIKNYAINQYLSPSVSGISRESLVQSTPYGEVAEQMRYERKKQAEAENDGVDFWRDYEYDERPSSYFDDAPIRGYSSYDVDDVPLGEHLSPARRLNISIPSSYCPDTCHDFDSDSRFDINA